MLGGRGGSHLLHLPLPPPPPHLQKYAADERGVISQKTGRSGRKLRSRLIVG